MFTPDFLVQLAFGMLSAAGAGFVSAFVLWLVGGMGGQLRNARAISDVEGDLSRAHDRITTLQKRQAGEKGQRARTKAELEAEALAAMKGDQNNAQRNLSTVPGRW